MNLFLAVLLSLWFTLAMPFARDGAIPAIATPPTPRSIAKRARRRSVFELQALIHAAARKHRVPVEFVKSIVAAESNFNSNAVSSKGAIGPMQLMPATAREWGGDPAIVEQNIDAGTRYLGFLMNHYRKSRKPLAYAIAAYNAGPGAVDRYHGVPPYPETRGYVVRVLSYMRQFQHRTRRGTGRFSLRAMGVFRPHSTRT
jgi:soluble lytic murein transglycosylase-like protein